MHIDKGRRIQRDGIHFYESAIWLNYLGSFCGRAGNHSLRPQRFGRNKGLFHRWGFLCKAVCQDIADLTISLGELLSARKAVNKALDGQVKDSKHLLKSL